MMETVKEVNFDCLIGPTHNFGGLSFGNTASVKNKHRVSSPKRAALQGLEKMLLLYKRGFIQGILPPHERPLKALLNNLGCDETLKTANNKIYELIMNNACSSSAMWAANSATISPSLDCLDNKTHITIANLVNKLHRSIEANFTYEIFKKIFCGDSFMVHNPLYAHDIFSDEGAANHNRIAPKHGDEGIEIFVYSKTAGAETQKTKIFPSRQSLLASEIIAVNHHLRTQDIFFVEQNPFCIDKGAFHNDVVCTMNENVIVLHEKAFLNQQQVLNLIKNRFAEKYNQKLFIIEITEHDLSMENAVSSYLFNSQLLTKDDGSMLLFAPLEVKENAQSLKCVEKILESSSPINEVLFFNVSESMANGGGPACLRLRMQLSTKDLSGINPQCIINEDRYEALKKVIVQYYPDEFDFDLLKDKDFTYNTNCALDQISAILGLKGIYSFQK